MFYKNTVDDNKFLYMILACSNLALGGVLGTKGNICVYKVKKVYTEANS